MEVTRLFSLENLEPDHPLARTITHLSSAGVEDIPATLGRLALDALALDALRDPIDPLDLSREFQAPPDAAMVLDRRGDKTSLTTEEVAEIANALRTKERMIRAGFYDETTGGEGIAAWANDLSQLAALFTTGS